jgi:hypothetical protein
VTIKPTLHCLVLPVQERQAWCRHSISVTQHWLPWPKSTGYWMQIGHVDLRHSIGWNCCFQLKWSTQLNINSRGYPFGTIDHYKISQSNCSSKQLHCSVCKSFSHCCLVTWIQSLCLEHGVEVRIAWKSRTGRLLGEARDPCYMFQIVCCSLVCLRFIFCLISEATNLFTNNFSLMMTATWKADNF